VTYLQNLFTSRDNNADGATYVGQTGRIWWNPDTNAFYYSDGNTAGGVLITGGSSGNGVPGGTTGTVQYNAGSGTFGGDVNFTFDVATSTLTVTNIVTTNPITGGAGGGNTQVLFNDSGNIAGNTQFTFNKATNTLTQTGIAYFGNVYAQANNVSSLGTPTNRFYGLWLGSGDINLIDNTLNINQQINAQDGNIVISGGNGIKFGQFEIYGNTISTINPAANINIGLVGSTGYVDIERPVAINSTGGGAPVFIVEQTGTVGIFSYGLIAANTAALLINGTAAGTDQPRNFPGTLIQATAQDNSPARMSADAFGVDGSGQNAYASWAGRVARGNVTTPTQTLAGDTMFRFTSQGWSNSGAYIGSIIRYNQVALENFATGKAGTRHNFSATAIGSATLKSIANIDANGFTFTSGATGGPADTGITFQDGSYQNTAYLSTSVVRSLTAGSGIGLSSGTGNITITNTGVLGVVGTTNQITVGNVGNVLTLSLPQNINTTANVQLYSLTVQDLIILGNISNVIPSVVGGNIIYVANTATNISSINNSGLITGNAANGAYAGILYNTTSNTWVMDTGNSVGITSDTVYATELIANANLHVGNAVAGNYDFPEALIQGDTDVNSYSQYVLKNHNQGASASADIVAVANNGDDGSYYIDMGVNSNVYANAAYAVTVANDGYLYVNGGNLAIGTQTAGKVINFFTGGTGNTNKIRVTISDTGLTAVGNITANNMISTNATIGSTVTATGNVTGGNLVTGGQLVATGNINGLNVNTGIVTATGNINAANLRTTGSVTATGNVIGGNLVTLGTANVGNITTANISAGNITSALISATGNITGPNITATFLTVSTTLQVSGNITGGNLLTDGIITTTGNITGNVFLGNGSQLTGITVTRIANGTSQVNIPVASGNANITIGATANVAVFTTGGANIAGNLSVTGNAAATYFLGNGAALTGLNAYGNVVANGTAVLATTGSSTLTMTPGNNQVITGNNTSKTVTIAVNDNPTFATANITGNITAANFIGNIISATNISNVGNLYVQGNIQYNLSVGDGGNVTQLTNKATAVTCNGRTGRITTSSAALSGGGSVTFTVNNTYVEQYDLIILNVKDPVRANTYHAQVNGVGTNSFNIMLRNIDNNSRSDAIILSFALVQVR